jgi:hypothetical protein
MKWQSMPCAHAFWPACGKARGKEEEKRERGMCEMVFGALPAYLNVSLREGWRRRSDCIGVGND